jgi:hypothetical protein
MTRPARGKATLLLYEPGRKVLVTATMRAFHRSAVPLERAVVELCDRRETDSVFGFVLVTLVFVRAGDGEDLVADVAAERLVSALGLFGRAIRAGLGLAADGTLGAVAGMREVVPVVGAMLPVGGRLPIHMATMGGVGIETSALRNGLKTRARYVRSPRTRTIRANLGVTPASYQPSCATSTTIPTVSEDQRPRELTTNT